MEAAPPASSSGAVPTLLDLCITAVAVGLPDPNIAFDCAKVPEPELLRRIVRRYERAYGDLDLPPPLPPEPLARYMPQPPVPEANVRQCRARLTALCKLAPCWQPQAVDLRVMSSGWDAPAIARRLGLVGARLCHLELSALQLRRLEWAPPLPIANLTCLSLAGCVSLERLPEALAALRRAAPALRALSLRGLLSGVDDTAGPALAALTQLEALDVSGTFAGDGLLECLTYGHRYRAWAAASGAAGAGAPECSSIVRLHLANTRVTAAGVAGLLAMPALDLIDVHSTAAGRTPAALAPLARRFGLAQPKPAVAARGHALAAVTVGGEMVPCCCAAGALDPRFRIPPPVEHSAPGVDVGVRAAHNAADFLQRCGCWYWAGRGGPTRGIVSAADGATIVRRPQSTAAYDDTVLRRPTSAQPADEDDDNMAARCLAGLFMAPDFILFN